MPKYPRGNAIQQYAFNIALGFDQWVNTLLLGDPDDTLSGRCGRALASGKPKWFVPYLAGFVDYLFLKLFNQKNHCLDSIEPEDRMTYEIWKWYL